ncbi:MAG: HYR domain-containing protein [Flavobacteriales bacterium]|nr:HYR domain-containing protein [Flavobacteriales bacterium]
MTFTPPTAQDNCFATLTRTAGPPSGALFPIGDTSVEFTATDPQGNSVTCGFNVHVDDLTAPVFTYCPDTLTVASDPGQCGAVVNYASPFAEDNCIATLTPPTGQLSGAFFPVGSTAVSYTVTDGISNATCTFQILVIDNEAPTIVGLPANISVSTDPSDSTALVTWAAPTASDNCAATIAADHASGDAFGIGTPPTIPWRWTPPVRWQRHYTRPRLRTIIPSIPSGKPKDPFRTIRSPWSAGRTIRNGRLWTRPGTSLPACSGSN